MTLQDEMKTLEVLVHYGDGGSRCIEVDNYSDFMIMVLAGIGGEEWSWWCC